MARSSRLESGFQDRLIESLKALFPGCMVFKMDQIQGLPDLLILYGEKWASLECKRSATAKKRPNQDYSKDYGKTFGLAITMDGSIVADYITTGVLNADVIRAGTLKDYGGNFSLDFETGKLTTVSYTHLALPTNSRV